MVQKKVKHSKLLWFWCCARFRKHELQTLSGSWNTANYYGFGAVPNFPHTRRAGGGFGWGYLGLLQDKRIFGFQNIYIAQST
jgi:hypothetical protein